MRHFILTLLLASLGWLSTGCGSSNQVPSTVEDSPLKAGFENASPAIQEQINQADQAIQDDRYVEAFNVLQKVGSRSGLTSAQKDAIFETVTKMKKVMDYHPRIGTKEAYAAMRDLIGTLDSKYEQGRRRKLPGE